MCRPEWASGRARRRARRWYWQKDDRRWRKEGARVVVRFARGRASSPSLHIRMRANFIALHSFLFGNERSESDVRGRGDEAREISSEFAATYV